MDIKAQAMLRHHERCNVILAMIVCQAAYYYQLLFMFCTEKIPHHTSILTGKAWVLELLNGHEDQIKICLGVKLKVFEALVEILVKQGFKQSRHGISVDQQLAIFLYTCVTGLSSRQVAERFQHSPTTINRCVESWVS
jgi:hypothetical protein